MEDAAGGGRGVEDMNHFEEKTGYVALQFVHPATGRPAALRPLRTIDPGWGPESLHQKGGEYALGLQGGPVRR